MYQEYVKVDKPEVLLITPLRAEDGISSLTGKSILENDVPFDWISFSSDNNPVVNCQKAMEKYKQDYYLPKYLMKLDNDIDADMGWIDSMYGILERSNRNVAYAYTSFEYYGHINMKFPARKFDFVSLKRGNYISFNSLIKTFPFLEVDGFVDLEGQDRLWDWALWLKFLKYGYIGTPVYGVRFRVYASPNSISCGSAANYHKNYNLIKKSYLFQ